MGPFEVSTRPVLDYGYAQDQVCRGLDSARGRSDSELSWSFVAQAVVESALNPLADIGRGPGSRRSVQTGMWS